MRRRRRGIVDFFFRFVCVGGEHARRLSHNGTVQLRRTHHAATRRTAQISHHLPHMGWPE
jgi:hypothetical protein